MSEGGEARSGKRPESVRTGEGETFGERAERLGGEARNHEAEVEAVARALDHWVLGGEDLNLRAAQDAIAALDAVRRSPDSRERDVLVDFAAYLKVPTPWAATVDAFLVEYDGVSPPPQGKDHELREKIADELAHNDECASRHLASRAEYLADADAILRIVGEHGPQGEDHEARAIEAERDGARMALDAAVMDNRDLRASIDRLVAGIQWVRGMCSDGEPYEVIDAKLAELLDVSGPSPERDKAGPDA